MQYVVSYPSSPEECLNLHEALQALMPPKSDYFKPGVGFPDRQSLIDLSGKIGMEGQNYGAYTFKAVGFFQVQEGLKGSSESTGYGRVDPDTANLLNLYLWDAGAFDPPDFRRVRGQVRYEGTGGAAGDPAPFVPVHLFDASGSQSVKLASSVTGTDGRYEMDTTFGSRQRRWVGVPTASGYAPEKELVRGNDRYITADLLVAASASDLAFTVQGTVLRPADGPQAGQPVDDVVVSVFVVSEGNRKLASADPTAADGSYRIASAARSGATLMVGIEGDGGLVARSSSWAHQGGTTVKDLTLALPAEEGPYIVRGQVTGLVPEGGVLVRAYDQDIRSQELLGESRPGSDGAYEIRYRLADFGRVDKPGGGADLRMRVFVQSGQELPVTPTRVPDLPYNAPMVAVINLVVGPLSGRGPSEFERYLAEIELIRDEVPVAEFTVADVDFVSGELEIDAQRIAWLQIAHALELQNGGTDGVPAAAFYGWFRTGQPTQMSLLSAVPAPALAASLQRAIDSNFVPASLIAQVEEITATVANPQRETLGTVLGPLGLSDEVRGALASGAGMVSEVSEGLVSNLVDKGTLSTGAATDLGLAASLHVLLGGQTAAAEVIRTLAFPRLAGWRLSASRDLARLNEADWVFALETSNATAPQGMDLPSYATQLARTVAKAYPTDYLLHRVVDSGQAREAWRELQALRPQNPGLLMQPFERLSLDRITTTRRAELADRHAELGHFVNLHPGLGLAELLQNTADPDQGMRLASERVAWIAEVQQLNQGTVGQANGVDLLAVDYLPMSGNRDQVRFGGQTTEQQTQVVASLKVYQRLHLVTGDAHGSQALLGAGLHSATAIARSPLADIVARTGLGPDEALAYHGAAVRQTEQAALSWFALHDAERDSRLYAGSIVPKLPAGYLQQLAGYAEMFGSVDSCRCDPCQSMLSPAAYFVDLMHYVERYILQRRYTLEADGYDLPEGLPEDHPLHLHSRRPDLWNLPLTYENTQDFVPTLQLGIDTLEPFIARAKGLRADDRQGLYKLLADQDRSPRQPYNRPLVRLSLLLKHFGSDRYQIAKQLAPVDLAATGTTPARLARARARLGLSLQAAQLLLGTRLSDIPAAARLYTAWSGTDPALTPDANLEINGISVRPLMRATSLDRDTLVGLALSRFVSADGSTLPPVTTKVVVVTQGGVQIDTEQILHLSLRRLDRLEVFLRLWQLLPWTITELDQTLERLLASEARPTGSEAPLHAAALIALVELMDLQDRWTLPVDEWMALWSELPSMAIRDARSLWDRRFNLPAFAAVDGPLPPDDLSDLTRFFRPGALSPDGKAMPSDRTQQRVAAALQLPDTDLVALFLGLGPCFAGAASNEVPLPEHLPIPLSRANLTLLYRHAQLARLLGLKVGELLSLMALTPGIGDTADPSQRCVTGHAQLLALVSMRDWVATSGFGLDRIRTICHDARVSAETTALAQRMVQAVRDEGALYFADTVLTQIGLSEAQSRALIQANAEGPGDPIEPVAGTGGNLYRLRASTGWSAGEAPTLVLSAVPQSALTDWLVQAVMTIAALGDFTKDSFSELGLSADEWQLNVIEPNTGPELAFEQVDVRYRLQRPYNRPLSLSKFDTELDRALSDALNLQCRRLLLRHDAMVVLANQLAAILQRHQAEAASLLALVHGPARPVELAVALQGGPVDPLAASLGQVVRRAELLSGPVFDAAALATVASNPEVFQLSRQAGISTEAVRRVALFVHLALPPVQATLPGQAVPDGSALLERALAPSIIHVTESGATRIDIDAATPRIAIALALDEALVRPVLHELSTTLGQTLAGLDGLQAVRLAADLARSLGMSPEVLALAVTTRATTAEEYSDLDRAAEGVYGTFRSRYPDQKAFDEQMAPFEDKLRSLHRDALVECLLHDDTVPDWGRRFQTRDDLFNHFLMDVMVEGCARTSRMVAAISTVQLYVQRVLMNLEQSAAEANGQTLFVSFANDGTGDGQRRAAEWAWRQHYRVWEANRKVFLYPENYIEPGLRDDKTPLFKALEDTLLQQEIRPQTALDAYTNYLAGLDEIAGLKIAGACHDRAMRADVLHLFGVTSSEPPIHYYRTIRQLERPEATAYGPWEPLNLQIPVRSVAPVVVRGRLIVLWVETTTRQLSNIENGGSKFSGYRHTVRTKFSQLRLDGRWSPPQTVLMKEGDGDGHDSQLIDDPLTWAAMPTAAARRIANMGLHLNRPTPLARLNQRPIYDPTGERYDQTGETDTDIELEDVPKADPPVVSRPPGPRGAEASFNLLTARWDERRRSHLTPLEEYVPNGWRWQQPYPSSVTPDGPVRMVFVPAGGDPLGLSPPRPSEIDFATRVARLPGGGEPPPPITSVSSEMLAHKRDSNSLILRRRNYQTTGTPFADATFFLHGGVGTAERGDVALLRFDRTATVQIVNGNEGSAVIHLGNEVLLLSRRAGPGMPPYELRRLGTTLLPQLGARLALASGVAGLLDTSSQKQLAERPPTLVLDSNAVNNRLSTSPFDPHGGLAGYYREIYFHIPFLVANHLNSRQKFNDARYWYDFVFNPAARNAPGDSAPARPWRYLPFRAEVAEDFHQSLTDPNALQAYREDPFNPHAIARLRPGASKKAVVMKYIDNLLDWGDQLFGQFTTESVNEAMMLYVKAAEILGPRPVFLGPCDEPAGSGPAEEPRTYARLKPLLTETSDLLIEECELMPMKSSVWAAGPGFKPPYVATWKTAQLRWDLQETLGGQRLVANLDASNGQTAAVEPMAGHRVTPMVWTSTGGTALSAAYGGSDPMPGVTQSRAGTDPGSQGHTPPAPVSGSLKGVGGTNVPIGKSQDIRPHGLLPTPLGLGGQSGADGPGTAAARDHLPDLVAAKAVFCLPANKDLLGYWDRVEDRLYKIRNCMDMAGVRRSMALFDAEIDPRMLVRMRAAGLTLDDVLNATTGHLPPYRFQFLIDKAKQHASLVQSFGTQLLSALEKKDAEELSQLRAVHERNLLNLRTSMATWEITASVDTLESLKAQRSVAEQRRDHFQRMVSEGLNGWERANQVLLHGANAVTLASSLLSGTGGILSLIPNLGAPTSLNYGGRELGSAAKFWTEVLRDTAHVMQLGASSTSFEGSNLRREQEWQQQAELANRDLEQIDKQIEAAEIRQSIAEQALKVHQETITQSSEIHDFFRVRFSNFGRYTWLAGELQKLNRMAFNAALSMARLAEQAYLYERPDDSSGTLLSGAHWSAENAGLLAGDRLQLDLQQLERKFIETNYRTLEVEQAFSLLQFNPSALIALRKTGTCRFSVPEAFFDLSYPGQYRRRIKGVRLTLPCVIGPYGSVGATLTMTASQIRNVPEIKSGLSSVPMRHLTTLAASTAQNDAGVFEFSFRDERYMPFEGAGAISDWELKLPGKVWSFDYATITDVILRIAYTAADNSTLRSAVDGEIAVVVGALRKAGLSRVFSLRHEFPTAWSKLIHSPVGTVIELDVGWRHMPFYMQGAGLGLAAMELMLDLVDARRIGNGVAHDWPVFSFDTATPSAFVADTKSDPLTVVVATLGSHEVVKTHMLTLLRAGDLASPANAAGTTSLDLQTLSDVLIRLTWAPP